MIRALHGFLGLPSDWQGLAQAGELPRLTAENLWPDVKLDLTAWAEAFADRTPAGAVLLGYSMGGRLAMHALLTRPRHYRAAILVSANPGLASAEARTHRLRADQNWAKRFAGDTDESWVDVVKAWNAQPVLRSAATGEAPLDRPEQDFSRAELAAAMDRWSLGRQDDLRERLVRLPMPVLYLSGTADRKFTELMGQMPRSERQIHQVIDGSGHRVPWENPDAFLRAVTGFLSRV